MTKSSSQHGFLHVRLGFNLSFPHTPLLRTSVEETNTTARDGKVKLAFSNVSSYIGCLHNHLLASNGCRSEGKPRIWSGKVILRA